MKRLVRRWLLRGLLRFARQQAAGDILGLTYHAIDESGSPVSFPKRHFKRQVEWLAAEGYQSLTASEAAAALAGDGGRISHGVVLTFDDGFRSVSETALPILSQHGFRATVFCAAGYVGKVCGWERAPGVPAMEMMSWDDLRLLVDRGWEVGGHTISHANLPLLSPKDMREEIAGGRRILENGSGSRVVSFAYPYGAFNALGTQAAKAAGFRSGWTMAPHINHSRCDLFTLGRFNCDRIQSEDPEAAEFALRTYASGRYGAYALLTARRLRVRRCRVREG